jgi:hypothetical protein
MQKWRQSAASSDGPFKTLAFLFRVRAQLESRFVRRLLSHQIPKHNAPMLQRALTKQWLWNQGVPNMRQQWIGLHYPAPQDVAQTAGTAVGGPACTVVWEPGLALVVQSPAT